MREELQRVQQGTALRVRQLQEELQRTLEETAELRGQAGQAQADVRDMARPHACPPPYLPGPLA